jgi:SAM-dependent methyltransferase
MTDQENFYDRVAARFGDYTSQGRHTTEYPEGDPEQLFEARLMALGRPGAVALDAGCGDGRFTLRVAPRFGQVIGVDASEGMLRAARARQHAQPAPPGAEKVHFEHGNAARLPSCPDGTFDVVYSRRGPMAFTEYHRLLKSGGHFLAVGIGEQDARTLKDVFGRGQLFGRWDEPQSALARATAALTAAGFAVLEAREVSYDEHYHTPADLDRFLQGVPIFEDYDPAGDRTRLDAYVRRHQTPQGVWLGRHRTVLVAKRP